MGCTQSNQVSQKVQTVSNKSLLTMVGTSMKGSMILSFNQSGIQSQKCNTVLPKYSNALLKSSTVGYLTGGIQQLQTKISENTSISDQAYQGTICKLFYQVNINKLHSDPENAFQIMPQMINARYAHCAIILNNNLYVLGGRQYGDDQNGLLSACQRFQFASSKWHVSAPLMYPRSGGVAVLYEQHIYMFGGYTGNNTRNMTIETYSEGDQAWRRVPYSLHAGLQGLVAIPSPYSPSSVIIFGGRTGSGKTKQVCELFFDNSTVRHCGSMIENRSFHKAIVAKNKVYLFGGGPDNVQVYHLKEEISEVSKEISYLEHCSTKDLNSFSQFQHQINLSYRKKTYASPNYKNKVMIYGHALQPFSKIIDVDNLVVISQNQNLKHRFNQFQTSIRVNKEHSFVMGGINTDCTAVSSDVYSINLQTEEIKDLNSMKTGRYGFPAVVKGSYLYVIGGRKLGGDDVAILNQCERFSFETYQWESIASMKYKRHSSLGVVFGNYLFAIGGYKGKGIRSNQIELYQENDNKWIQLQEKFELAVESMTPISFANSIYLFGGRAEQIDIQKVFKLHINVEEGTKLEKAVRMELQPIGNLTKPGTNLKVFVSTGGMAYIFGNIEGGIDVYDLRTHQIAQMEKLSVFDGLEDKYFQSYTIVF